MKYMAIIVGWGKWKHMTVKALYIISLKLFNGKNYDKLSFVL